MARRNMHADKTLPLFAGEPDESTIAPTTGEGKYTRTICVFCGSSAGRDSAFGEAARRLGALIAENGWRLLFGGGGLGLMGEVARAARAAGAPVLGILPALLRHLEPPLEFGEKVVITPDLHQRKARMIQQSDAFVILSGGLGTFDEFFEVITTAQLGVHKKPVVVVNTQNYFAPLESLLDHVVAHGFARAEIMSLYSVVKTPEDATTLLSSKLSVLSR